MVFEAWTQPWLLGNRFPMANDSETRKCAGCRKLFGYELGLGGGFRTAPTRPAWLRLSCLKYQTIPALGPGDLFQVPARVCPCGGSYGGVNIDALSSGGRFTSDSGHLRRCPGRQGPPRAWYAAHPLPRSLGPHPGVTLEICQPGCVRPVGPREGAARSTRAKQLLPAPQPRYHGHRQGKAPQAQHPPKSANEIPRSTPLRRSAESRFEPAARESPNGCDPESFLLCSTVAGNSWGAKPHRAALAKGGPPCPGGTFSGCRAPRFRSPESDGDPRTRPWHGQGRAACSTIGRHGIEERDPHLLTARSHRRFRLFGRGRRRVQCPLSSMGQLRRRRLMPRSPNDLSAHAPL